MFSFFHKRYERVIELLRFVQPEIASAASFTLLSTRHQMERLQQSKRDCESNACEKRFVLLVCWDSFSRFVLNFFSRLSCCFAQDCPFEEQRKA
jgi:hypothetical protein